jgi:outer membrane biosynthesis protein TonB
MAFETFLTGDKHKPKRSRRLMYALSLGVHGLLLAVGVAGSYASVEELVPTNKTLVTFGQLPVPPPPPAGKKGNANKTKIKKPTKVRPNEIVAPADKVQPEKPDPDDGNDPVGTKDGITGSTGIGPGTAIEDSPRTLPPNVAKGNLAIDPQATQHRAKLPGYVHGSVWALMKVCVDRNGDVIDVKILKGVDGNVDASFVSAIRTWRYTPYKVDGRPVPFCTNVRYEVQTSY